MKFDKHSSISRIGDCNYNTYVTNSNDAGEHYDFVTVVTMCYTLVTNIFS